MFSFFLFAFSLSSSKRHGRKEESFQDDAENVYDDSMFLGGYDYYEYDPVPEEESFEDKEQEISVFEKYANNFDSLTRGQQNQVIAWALTELAGSVDNSATRNEIEYGIGGRLRTVLNNVDVQDKQMKKQFVSLQGEVDEMKGEIESLINETKGDLANALKSVRKDIMKELREIVAKSMEKNDEVAHSVNSNIDETVGKYKAASVNKAIAYFIAFQVLLLICIIFYSKYIKQVRLV